MPLIALTGVDVPVSRRPERLFKKYAYQISYDEQTDIGQNKIEDAVAGNAFPDSTVDDYEVVDVENRYEYKRLGIKAGIKDESPSVGYGNSHYQLREDEDNDYEKYMCQTGKEPALASCG